LTQALATHFEQCDGVDVSASMLEIAQRHNRHPNRCTYHRNPAPNLALFTDGSFDFAYSTLVLQHMEPRFSRHYISELLRVLAPGGLLVFQLPSQRSSQHAPADARRTSMSGRLPHSAFHARITTDQSSFSANPGGQLSLEVTVENQSAYVWPSLPDERGHCQITVGNHWLRDDEELLQRDDGRCPLPYDLAPGSRASVLLVATAPWVDGVYILELDLVQEDVSWFGERGSPTLRLPCVVGNGLATPRQTVNAPAPPPATFSARHPRAFTIMRATGVRDVYWAWRRGVDRVKTVRDRAREDVRDVLGIPRLINWWKRGPFSPRMEMHCVPRAEVEAILKDAGGHIVHVDEEWTPGYLSCRYWITKT
jgi:hypothetical protein